ncbi:hypothetical protein ACLKA7_005846 [Drosophila subpalustris]
MPPQRWTDETRDASCYYGNLIRPSSDADADDDDTEADDERGAFCSGDRPLIAGTENASADWLQTRHIFGLMGFLGFAVVYAMRVNLSVAIVAMVNRTDVPHSNSDSAFNSTSDLANDTCPLPPVVPSNWTTPHSNWQRGEFQWDEATQGLVLGSFFYGYVLTQVPGGRLAELLGGKRIYGYGVLITAIFTLLTPLAARCDLPLLVLVRVLEGMGEGVTYPAMHAMLAHWIPPLERNKFAAIVYAGSNIGTVISMPLTGWLCSQRLLGGWPSAFYIFGLLGIVWFVAWMHLVYDRPGEHPRISCKERTYIERALAVSRQRLQLEQEQEQREEQLEWPERHLEVEQRDLERAERDLERREQLKRAEEHLEWEQQHLERDQEHLQREEEHLQRAERVLERAERDLQREEHLEWEQEHLQRADRHLEVDQRDLQRADRVLKRAEETVLQREEHLEWDQETVLPRMAEEALAPEAEHIPWRAILSSVPLWAILVTQCGQSWAFYTQLTELPTYMSNILHFDIQSNALLNAIPYLTAWFVGIGCSALADWMLARRIISQLNSYRLWNSVSSVVPSLGLVGIIYGGCDWIWVTLMLAGVGSFGGAVYAGNQMNHIALSPRFAGTMYGITNSAANICGFLAPYVIGLIINHRETLTQWHIVFWLAVTLNVAGNFVYLIFARADEQSWSRSRSRSQIRRPPNRSLRI